ncbi:hypothetical protein [Celerinatantimonas sp. YJH-8]|uniref:hypothetical protein n=1 Tax=Celerinatantimonas sp. YJH-8 TaxID=3228714 RepID=UPI0038BEAE1C
MKYFLMILGVLMLSACGVHPSHGPVFDLKPMVKVWHFDQPESHQAWQSIQNTLTPSLAKFRVDSVTIQGNEQYQARVQALYQWLIKKGVPKNHIQLQSQSVTGVTVSIVSYQAVAERCQSPRILYKISDTHQHVDPCEVSVLRWESMVHPEHMIKAGE